MGHELSHILGSQRTQTHWQGGGSQRATPVQRWLEFLTAFGYTLNYRKGSANGNAGFLFRLPEPTTEHDGTGSISLISVKDDSIFHIRACGRRDSASPISGVGPSRMVPETESDGSGGLPFASSDFRDFRTHRPRMRIDDLSAPSGGFVAHVTATVTTDDCRSGRGEHSLPPTLLSLRLLQYPPGAVRARQKPPLRR